MVTGEKGPHLFVYYTHKHISDSTKLCSGIRLPIVVAKITKDKYYELRFVMLTNTFNAEIN